MIDNLTLKAKLKKELRQLNVGEDKEDLVVRELNYLSNLLIDVYINKMKEEKND